ncbi:FAD-dependent oxidoreductase [Streptomyces monticola]|uniref:FAD-dependent oxidoreductase n=1 Tax=Streptomyces monticola TaxID=2666263 RepID=A0ABW2JNK2_9ACTN
MSHQVSRRSVLAGTAGAAALTLAGHTRSQAAPAARRPTVAVLGGGVAGLSAAQELTERGFDVTVYERGAWGGKARSMPVPKTGTGGRADLPGEHGHRFFLGTYRHLPDTLSRIPFPGNPRGVLDNLTAVPTVHLARAGGRPPVVFPLREAAVPETLSPDLLRTIVLGWLRTATHLPPHEALRLAHRILVFVTSSEERRFGQWEHVPWWRFMRAEGTGDEYRDLFVVGLTRNLNGMKAEVASANVVGRTMESVLLNLLGHGYRDPVLRVLDAPTNEAWIDPWLTHLSSSGAVLRLGWGAEKLNCAQGRITSATVRGPNGTSRQVGADWYVLAVPAERAAPLIDRAVLEADPRLAGIARIRTEWMAGLQYYLREPVDIGPGHLLHVDTPWAITSVNQAPLWPGRDFGHDFGDGSVRDCLSVVIADFEQPGILYGEPARDCTPRQLAREVWAQINGTLEKPLPDRVLHSWFLPPGLRGLGTPHPAHDEPLLVNYVGGWQNRPPAGTALPNLFLAADYVRTSFATTSMEAANEAARHAVNALLAAAGSRAEPCRLWPLYQPPEFEPAKRQDRIRYRMGLPNAFDLPEGRNS